MRGLVALVTLMSVLIVAGLALFAYGMATKLAPDTVKEHPALVLPAGSRIEEIAGYKNGLAFHVVEKGEHHIYLVSPSTGKITAHLPVSFGAKAE